ncbi:polyprenyl synthetase family protein [bacterium]|nr:polyprenyl synthetase family protein [bacterium]
MNIIENELKQLDEKLKNSLKSIPKDVSDNIFNFIFSKSKRIRPSLIFFVANAMKIKISDKILNLSAAVEIIHNATLIHDDIIDNANTRRGKKSLNIQLGNNLSVLSGDILLSIAMKLLCELENIEIIKLFSSTLEKMCQGEINQHFSLYKVPSINEYIEKSKNKTAKLFEAALVALCILESIEQKNNIKDFAINYGIAFQIKDDLENILQTDTTKPALSDIRNGIYTLPIILLAQDKPNITNLPIEEIIDYVKNNTEIKNKTLDIIKKHTNKAIKSLDFLCDNEYKQEIIKLANSLF